jgi:hypothetical protein
VTPELIENGYNLLFSYQVLSTNLPICGAPSSESGSVTRLSTKVSFNLLRLESLHCVSAVVNLDVRQHRLWSTAYMTSIDYLFRAPGLCLVLF